MDATMLFSRTNAAHHTFSMPASAWTPGATLSFAAKPVVDDDNTDAKAQIVGSWGDSAVTDVTLVINKVPTACKRYACNFPGSATSKITGNGQSEIELVGDFKYQAPGKDPITIPGDDNKIRVIVYMNVDY